MGIRTTAAAGVLALVATLGGIMAPSAGAAVGQVGSLAAGLEPTGGRIVAVPPERVLDTTPFWCADGSWTFKARRNVPADATAVVLTITTFRAAGPGRVTAAAAGERPPNASAVTYVRGFDATATTITRTDPEGRVTLWPSSGCPHMYVDLVGYVAGGAPAPGGFTALARPERAADTRSGACVPGGGSLRIPVAGRAGVPAGATAIALTVSAISPTGPGFLTVRSSVSPATRLPAVNYRDRNVAAMTLAGVAPDGTITIDAVGACVHVLVDVLGYTGPARDGSAVSMVQKRLVDTRGASCIAAGTDVAVGVDAPVRVKSVVATVTVIDPEIQGVLMVSGGPTGGTRLAYEARRSVTYPVVLTLGDGNRLFLSNAGRTGCIHVAVDLTAGIRGTSIESSQPTTTTTTTVPKPTTTTTSVPKPSTTTTTVPKPTTTTTTVPKPTTTTTLPPPAPRPRDGLGPGEVLHPGAALTSADGRFMLAMQSDGNLVLYHPWTGGSRAVFASQTVGTPGAVAVMQGDGNLVVYAPGGRPIWASQTDGRPGSRLVLQSDGNAVVYAPGGRPIWASQTVPPVPWSAASRPADCGHACETRVDDGFRQLQLVNQARQAAGIPPLRWNPRLAARAEWWAQVMRDQYRFEHSDLPYRAPCRGGIDCALGENIGISPYPGDSPASHDAIHTGMHNAYMRSPSHRANVLSREFTDVGIAWIYRVERGRLTALTVQYYSSPF